MLITKNKFNALICLATIFFNLNSVGAVILDEIFFEQIILNLELDPRSLHLEDADLNTEQVNHLIEKILEEKPHLLDSIEYVFLADNKLEAIPLDLVKLPNLKKIDLSSNQIEDASLEPFNWEFIKNIDLSNNKIKEFELNNPSIASSIQELNLSSNQITVFQAPIPMQSLNALHLGFNQLGQVPDLKEFKKLEVVNFSYNKLRTFSLYTILPPSLRKLSLNNNRIESLSPDALVVLSQLRFFDLSYNPVQQEILSILTSEESQETSSLKRECQREEKKRRGDVVHLQMDLFMLQEEGKDTKQPCISSPSTPLGPDFILDIENFSPQRTIEMKDSEPPSPVLGKKKKELFHFFSH